MPKANPSTKATDHATLSFGLVSIPVSVYTGVVSDHGIKRKEFVSVPVLNEDGSQKVTKVEKEDGTFEEVPVFEDHPVGRMAKDKITEEPIPAGTEVVRKIETEYGFVYVEDSEIEQLFEIAPKTIAVKEFQPQHLFHQGAYVPKSLYYIEPTKVTVGKRKVANTQAEKLLAMVFKGMREEGAMAVVEFTTRGIPKPAVLLPDGSLWVVYHTDALREQRELPEVELNDALVAQARTLIKSQWGTEPLDLSDVRSALIQNFADEKARAGDFDRPAVTEAEPVVQATDDSDLMALLAASVETAKQGREAV